MFHDGPYKVNVYHNQQVDGSRFEGELYDMREDPAENRNLWNCPNHAAVKADLLGSMMNWNVDVDVRHWGSRGGERFRRSVMKEYHEQAHRQAFTSPDARNHTQGLLQAMARTPSSRALR